MQQIDQYVTLNGPPLQSFFFPATFFFLSGVVLLSLHFIYCYYGDSHAYLMSLLDIDVVDYLLHSGKDGFWHWVKWFKPWFALPDPPKPPKIQSIASKRHRTEGRKKLKLLMQAAAVIPLLGFTQSLVRMLKVLLSLTW